MEICFKGMLTDIDVCRVNKIGMIRGLMLKRLKNSKNLLFEFNKDVNIRIHSFFVGFPFLALWLNSCNKVIGWEIVKPWEFGVWPGRKFRKLIEIPVCARNIPIIKVIVGKQKI